MKRCSKLSRGRVRVVTAWNPGLSVPRLANDVACPWRGSDDCSIEIIVAYKVQKQDCYPHIVIAPVYLELNYGLRLVRLKDKKKTGDGTHGERVTSNFAWREQTTEPVEQIGYLRSRLEECIDDFTSF